jgi:CRP-like cAMP-binding protein
MPHETVISFVSSHVPASRLVLEQVADAFTERPFAKNEVLLQAGTVSDEYLLLTEGYVRAFTLNTDNDEVTTNFFWPRRPVFEVSSLFLRTPAAETLQTISDGRGYSLSFEALNQLFHALPEFREFGRAMLVREFAAFKQRALSLINQTADQRYADMMATHPDLFQNAQLRHIASYLGVTDSSLSRIRREFMRRGQ